MMKRILIVSIGLLFSCGLLQSYGYCTDGGKDRKRHKAAGHDNIVRVTFDREGSMPDNSVSVDAAATVILEAGGDSVRFAVVPPHSPGKIKVTLKGEFYPVEADPRVSLIETGDGVTIISADRGSVPEDTDIDVIFATNRIPYRMEFGAYPESCSPRSLEKRMETILGRYERLPGRLSPLEKRLLVRAFEMAGQATGNPRYDMTGARIKQMEADKADLVPGEFLKEQIALFDRLEYIEANNKEVGKDIFDRLEQSCLAQSRHTACDEMALSGMRMYNSVWGITRRIGRLWLNAYRLKTLDSLDALSTAEWDWDQEPLKDAALLLGLSGACILTQEMALPPGYVTDDQYTTDNAVLKRLTDSACISGTGDTKAIMLQAAKAQMDNVFKGKSGDAIDADRSWYRGSLYTGIMGAWHATKDPWYLEQAVKLSERNNWEPGPNAMKDGNDLAISQIYLELYEAGVEGADIGPTKKYLDKLVEAFDPGKIEWSWCDALFMSPPAWARMGRITGEMRYFDHMDKLWWQTSGIIYDKEAALFFRDKKTVPSTAGVYLRERNGEKMFWGRGNGWVMGGLCRVLDYLPRNYPSRPLYETMFRDMCASLLKTQKENGLWGVSLLDPQSYPMGETSGSTFFCYAFAWGINNGLLEEDVYWPAALRAWRGLVACIDGPGGRLGYVQYAADSPLSPVYRLSNLEYATGAFLLAGGEILKLMEAKRFPEHGTVNIP